MAIQCILYSRKRAPEPLFWGKHEHNCGRNADQDSSRRTFFRQSHDRSLAELGRPGSLGGDCQRRLLGYFLARDHRARLFLDAGTPAHSIRRNCGRPGLIVGDLQDHVWRRRCWATVFSQRSRLPRPAGRIHTRLGRRGHADLGPLRQLVARRLRPRRQDCQSPSHAAGARDLRNQLGRRVFDGRETEPLPRSRAQAVGISVAGDWRVHHRADDDAQTRVRGPHLAAQRISVRGDQPGRALRIGSTGAGHRTPLGPHYDHRNLYRILLADAVDPASVPSAAEARAGLPEDYPHGPAALPNIAGGRGLALDLAWPALGNQARWKQALLGGVGFLAILIAVEWPFATFMNSPAANNWF